MSYRVQKVSTAKELTDFLKIPYRVYKNDENWIAPLNSEIRRSLNPKLNPYFKNASLELFVCYDNEIPVSRAVVVINKLYKQKYNISKALFGYFESINETAAVKILFKTIEDYCRDMNVELIEGPFNPNHYSELGIKTDKFDSLPAFFQTHNPEYYSTLLKETGFNISKILHTRKNDNVNEYLFKKYGEVKSLDFKGYNVRSFSNKNFKNDLEAVREIFNDAFESNWNFLPVSKEEYLFSAKYLKLVTYPDLIKIVEYKGQPVGVLQCVLDINPLLQKFNGKINIFKYFEFLLKRKKIDTVLIYAVGIKKAYQGRRVFLMLLNEMCRIARCYKRLETTWMTDSNELAIKASEKLGLIPDKHFQMYEKIIDKI